MAVCVDVTDPEAFIDKATGKPVLDERGEPQKPKFKYVFETALIAPDGRPYTVDSRPFSESYHEKSPHRPFLVSWMGHTMGVKELAEFDTKNMVGKCAFVIIKGKPSAKDPSKAYANIEFIEATTEMLKPSGLYVRHVKRTGDATRSNTGAHAGAAEDWESTKIHLKTSGFKDSEVREVPEAHLITLIEKWLPQFKASAKTTADDKRLAFALEQWQARKAVEPDDNGGEESDLDEVPL